MFNTKDAWQRTNNSYRPKRTGRNQKFSYQFQNNTQTNPFTAQDLDWGKNFVDQSLQLNGPTNNFTPSTNQNTGYTPIPTGFGPSNIPTGISNSIQDSLAKYSSEGGSFSGPDKKKKIVVEDKPKDLNNWEKFGIGADAVGTLGQAWLGLQGLDLAKEGFRDSRNTANTNAAAQSTALAADLEGKYYAQAMSRGLTREQANAEVNQRINSLNLPTNISGGTLNTWNRQ